MAITSSNIRFKFKKKNNNHTKISSILQKESFQKNINSKNKKILNYAVSILLITIVTKLMINSYS